MLKFFRKIRQKLVNEGNVKRYLIYAFGEILLVMFGILLALAVNNWNHDKLNQTEEQRILKDLSEELQFNRFLQKTGSERMGEVIGAAESLIDDIDNPESSRSNEQTDLNIHKLTWVWMSGRPTTIYDVLSGSGDFELITSTELRKKLADLKSNQEILMEFERIQTRFVDEQLRPFLNRMVDRTTIRISQKADHIITTNHTSRFPSSNRDVLEDREFANLLQDLLFFTRRLIETYNRIEMDIVQIDSIIVSVNPSIQAQPYVPY